MKIINSVQNETIKYYEKLNDKAFRKKEGLFLIEGYHLVEEALKTKFVCGVLSTDEKYLNQLPNNINTYLVNESIIKKLSNTKNPQNVLAVVKILNNDLSILDETLKKDQIRLLAFEEINDPGNLGTLIRTAAGLGFDGVILSNTSVDLYNDKTLRASQGTIFKIKIVYGDIQQILKNLQQKDISLIGTSLDKATELKLFTPPQKMVLCLGNEARGMSKELLAKMNQNIKITMANDVESLNVMIAGSIIMYELTK